MEKYKLFGDTACIYYVNFPFSVTPERDSGALMNARVQPRSCHRWAYSNANGDHRLDSTCTFPPSVIT